MSRTMKGAGERERERVAKQVESKSIASCICLHCILSAKCTHPRRELVKACEGMSMWTNTHVGCVHYRFMDAPIIMFILVHAFH